MQLRALLSPLVELQKSQPELFVKKGLIQALTTLAQESSLTEDVDLSYLNLQAHKALVDSKLFGDYMAARFEKKLTKAMVSEQKEAVETRYQTVKDLLATKPEHEGLVLAATLLNPSLSYEAKVKFLTAKPERFDVWSQWAPCDSLLELRCLFVDMKLKDFAYASFHKAIHLLGAAEDCFGAIKHPAVKSLVVAYWHMVKLSDSDDSRRMLEGFFQELCNIKIGVTPSHQKSDAVDMNDVALNPEMVKYFGKLAAPDAKAHHSVKTLKKMFLNADRGKLASLNLCFSL